MIDEWLDCNEDIPLLELKQNVETNRYCDDGSCMWTTRQLDVKKVLCPESNEF